MSIHKFSLVSDFLKDNPAIYKIIIENLFKSADEFVEITTQNYCPTNSYIESEIGNVAFNYRKEFRGYLENTNPTLSWVYEPLWEDEKDQDTYYDFGYKSLGYDVLNIVVNDFKDYHANITV